MDCKPSFTWWDGLGRCVIYPVSVHVSGRQWDEKSILVPVQAWQEGVRKFGFVDARGVTSPEYTVTPKVEKGLSDAVAACESFYDSVKEMRRIQYELNRIRSKMDDMSYDYNIPLFE